MADTAAVTAPRPVPAPGASPLAIGAVLAIAAGVWQGVKLSIPLNDDFLHLALAQQLLAGDWPVRDFFDNGLVLQMALSAAAQVAVGHRLLSEALVVGGAWAISTFLVFTLVRRLTGSTLAAVLSALLLIVAGPRGYSYPKVIVYAVAASLWWAYVWTPTAGRIVMLGAWTALAFYWRPDHGAYVAAGTVLAAAAAHGVTRLTVARSVLAGGVAIVLTAPFFLLVHRTMGLGAYMETGFAQAEFQHEGGHAWPEWPLRRLTDVARLAPAEDYAPRATLRWTADSSPDTRRQVLERYGLTPEGGDGPLVERVRLSETSLDAVRELINEPAVEDTAGIDRSTATLPRSGWPEWERWRFAYTWLRVRVLPGLDEHTRAGEAVAAVFYALPAVVLLVVVPLRRYLAGAGAGALVAFTVWAVVVTYGLLRTPYDVRAVDAVALATILFALSVAVLWRAGRAGGGIRRWALTAAVLAFTLVTFKSVSVAGSFGERAGWLAGEWRSADRMRGAWREAYVRLTASPPLQYYEGRGGGVSVRLAAYAHECLPQSERLLVLWFAPEIYYYSGRLAAQRHLVVVPGWAHVAHEQRLTLEKVERYAPPLVFAGRLDGVTQATYPGVVEYVRRGYEAAGSLTEQDEQYIIFAKRDRPVVRTYGEQQWPCYL